MSSFLIKSNNNILGIYDDLNLALDYVYSLINSNLIKKSSNVIIYEYKINSCIIYNEYIIDVNYNIINKSMINYNKIIKNFSDNNNTEIYDSESSYVSSSIDTEEKYIKKKQEREILQEQNKIAQEKINIVHDINMFKEQLKKREELLNQYNYDLELYNKFKDLKNNNPLFTIPNMFEQKYNIFNFLDNNNNLSYENFIETYKPIKFKTEYDPMFESLSESNNSNISEIFSNADDNKLFIATNQCNTISPNSSI